VSFTVGGTSIAANTSFRWDGWSWPDGADHGVQILTASPFSPWHDGKLVSSEFNKVFGGDGRFYYGFRVTNEGPQSVSFNVQGGGVN